MRAKPAEIVKNIPSRRHYRFGKYNLILEFVLLASLVNFLFYKLIVSSLKTVLNQQTSQITRLNQIRGELERELKFYKEARIASEGKLFQQLADLKEELTKYKSQGKVLGENDIEKKVDEAVATLEEWLAGKEIATSSKDAF